MAEAALKAEDEALIERLAARIVELRLEVPAILTIESAHPLSVVAGQAMIFFEPIVQALFRIDDYRRYAALIERREALAALTRAIERHAEDARLARKAARGQRSRG